MPQKINVFAWWLLHRRFGLASEGEPVRIGTQGALRRWDWVEDSRNVICLFFDSLKIQRVRKASDVAKLRVREHGARLVFFLKIMHERWVYSC